MDWIEILGWIVWGLCVCWVIFSGVIWIAASRNLYLRRGSLIKLALTRYVALWDVIFGTGLLLAAISLPYSKLHLVWLFPLGTLATSQVSAAYYTTKNLRRLERRLEDRRNFRE